MNNSNFDFSKAAEFASAQGNQFQSIVNSSDGQKVKSLMEENAGALKSAMQAGDMTALKGAFDQLMNTDEGSRLIGQIKDMMK